MESESRPANRALETCVFLRRGLAPRKVGITVIVANRSGAPEAAPRPLFVFLRAVDAELFGPPGPKVADQSIHTERGPAVTVHALEASFPKMRPEAFGVLARMLERWSPETTRLLIQEEGPDATLVVRRLLPESATEATIADVPWRIVLPFSGPPSVMVEFREPIEEAVVALTMDRLTAWADVLSLGGFPGPQGEPFSRAALRSVGRAGDACVRASFDPLWTAHAGIEALFEGLSSLHEIAPIACVRVTSSSRLLSLGREPIEP